MRKARIREDEKAIASFGKTRKSRSVPLGEKRTTHYGNVIRQYREKAGLDQGTVGRTLGYSTNTISNWENGVSRPDIDAVTALCELLRIPLTVFFDADQDPAAPEDERELLKDFRSLGASRRQLARRMVHELARSDEELRAAVGQFKNRHCLPMQGLSAAAGVGTPLDDIEAPEFVYVKDGRLARMADEVFAVNGESMEPTFHDGDRVYVRYAQRLEPGEIGIFVVAGNGYIKEYRRDGLYSHNRAYKPIRPSEDDDVRCVGRVLGRVEPGELIGADELEKLF